MCLCCTSLCLQKHHSPALPDHHPGEEIPQSPDVPGGPAEHLRGSQSQVGGAVENLLSAYSCFSYVGKGRLYALYTHSRSEVCQELLENGEKTV